MTLTRARRSRADDVSNAAEHDDHETVHDVTLAEASGRRWQSGDMQQPAMPARPEPSAKVIMFTRSGGTPTHEAMLRFCITARICSRVRFCEQEICSVNDGDGKADDEDAVETDGRAVERETTTRKEGESTWIRRAERMAEDLLQHEAHAPRGEQGFERALGRGR